jgi:hypothetical protein
VLDGIAAESAIEAAMSSAPQDVLAWVNQRSSRARAAPNPAPFLFAQRNGH